MRELFYSTLKYYCRIILWFYFKRWQVANKKWVPDSPVIFVANHQNSFLDAVVVACSTHRDTWFLARGGVFEKSWARKILSWLKMMPVFRFRDGFGTLKKNDETFEACAALLSRGESVLIFAEGNHDDAWRLRPLQKGFARIALLAEQKNNWQLGVKIVPVGIQYEQKDQSLSRVLVTFGAPILVSDVIDATDSSADQMNDLITYTTASLQPLMLHIEAEDYQQKVNYLFHYRVKSSDLSEQLVYDQAMIQSYLPEESLPKPLARKRFWNPFYTYWFLNTLIPWLLIQWVLKTKMKDPQFTSSLKFSLGMVLVPLVLAAQTALCFHLTQSWMWAIAYFGSVPLAIKIHSRLV